MNIGDDDGFHIRIGYRAKYLIRLSESFINNPALNEIGSNRYDYDINRQVIKNLAGFGEYATAHLLLLLGYFNEIPIDTVVKSYLKKNYRVRKPASFISRRYQKWGAYKWWGLKLEKILKQQNCSEIKPTLLNNIQTT